jgi:hypothetical protein
VKKLALAGILSFTFLFGGCLGPNNLHDSIRNWNAEAAEEDWIKETIFLTMMIVPIYPVAYLSDILIFNTVAYWSGKNPIAAPDSFPGFGDY